MRGTKPQAREGFSLVEVIVAMVVLSTGLLAMAATTGYILNRTRATGYATERAVASQQLAEYLQSLPFASVVARDSTTPLTVGEYRFWWDVEPKDVYYKHVVVVSVGRGYDRNGLSESARDTFAISIYQP
ncbi:MAG TPA: prepilin-type N-terminal cleavage/methylation domain-containing protein [Longimicrobiales bacterium]